MAQNLLEKAKPARKRNIRRGAPPIVKPRRLRPRAQAPAAPAVAPAPPPADDAAVELSEEALAANDGKDGSRKEEPSNFLAMYFREMAALDVLEPQQEFVAARDIETLELLVWERMLSYPPLVAHLCDVLEATAGGAIPELRRLARAADAMRASAGKAAERRFANAARAAAAAVRTLDCDKLLFDAVTAELEHIDRGAPGRAASKRVRVSSSSRAFQRYLARVRQASRGAERARNDFVRANLRLVVSIARRFNHGRMALADLIQEGNIGLMKAVERYDYRRGFRFSTYASWWIRHAISRALADKGREVRLPVHMIDAYHRISKAQRELTGKLGRQPTSEEIARSAGIPAGKIDKMRTYLVDQSFSLDKPVNDDGDGRSLAEYLQDPEAELESPVEEMTSEAVTNEVRECLRDLKPIEADILRKRFGLDDDQELTLKEIGVEYNLSRERIRQLQEQALCKMRRALARKDML